MKTTSVFTNFDLSLLPKGTEHLFQKVLDVLGLNDEEYRSTHSKRPIDVVLKRQILTWVLRKSPFYLSYTKIARIMGKNHATMIHSDRTIDNILEVPNKYRDRVLFLVRKIVHVLLFDGGVAVDVKDYSRYGIIDKRVESFKKYILDVAKEVSLSTRYNETLSTMYKDKDSVKSYLIDVMSRISDMPEAQNVFIHENRMSIDSLIDRINLQGLNSTTTVVIVYGIDPRMKSLYKKLSSRTCVRVVMLEGDFTELFSIVKSYPIIIYIGNEFLVSMWIYGAITFQLAVDSKLELFKP